MPSIIQDAITSLLGGDTSDDWQGQLRPSSFRGVPFAIVAEEGSHGRRQAVHEYPYRDTAWIEDIGRATRRFVIRGFLIQNSQVYGGGDAITQRQSLIEACEQKGSGTLVHPTLGELTVSIPENGLRISGSMENGRVFEFTLMAIESGLKVFAVTGSTVAGATVKTNYLKLVSTAVLSTIARVKSEIRGVTQAINTIRGTVTFWTNMVDSTISQVTNLSNVLNSTFGNTRYGRYSKGSVGGTLVHPTLGELTVSIPENGLRISGSMENGRVFEFTLMAIESGLKVFAVTGSTVAGATVKTNYLKLVSTAVLSTIARVKSEIRGVTQAINTIRGTVTFWTNMVDSTISQVTNLSNVLNSTFGNTRYGRYSKGSVGGSSSAVAGKSSVADVDDERALADKVTAQSVMDRKNVTDRSSQLSSSNTPDEFVQGVADVVNAILNSAGSVNDRITALEKLANSISTEYQQSDSSKAVSATMNTLIVVLCTGAMTSAAADSRPASTDEAEELTQRVSVQLDTALVLAGDRADDDMYNALLAVRSAFLSTMSERASGLSELLQVTTAQPLPALTLANRLYQDATRADELVQEARVPHPAFMPTTMKVLRQ